MELIHCFLNSNNKLSNQLTAILLTGCAGLIISLFFCNGLQARESAKVPVLIYHEIVTDDKKPGETVISLDLFRKQMSYLAEQGYTTLSISELTDFMQEKQTVPKKSILLTFDDGWKNVLNAVPILEQHNFKASFCIIARDWFGPDYLSWEQIQQLDQHPNFEIGSHSVTHPWQKDDNLLTWLEGKPSGKGLTDIEYEIRGSRTILEEHLHHEVTFFAWPCGWYNSQLVQMAKDTGYQALLTTWQKPNEPGDDVFQIKRFYVNGACSMESFKQLLLQFKLIDCIPANSEAHGQPYETYSISQAKRK